MNLPHLLLHQGTEATTADGTYLGSLVGRGHQILLLPPFPRHASWALEQPSFPTMDTTQAKLLLELVPKLPLIVKVALLHLIKASPPSKYVDLRTELTVAILRSFLTPSTRRSISDTQRLANRDPGIKGRIWVAKYTAPAPPEPSVRDAVTHAIESLSTRPEALKSIEWPEVVGVEAEWTGYRSSATASSKLPPITEKEMYGEMMKEVKNPTTVLYLHGGAYYLMDPATHRPTTKKLAKLTGGRCYSVRYRLAPQNPFPAALLDALHSYLTLLHPPEGAYHEAVKPEHIIFAGDRYDSSHPHSI